MFEKKELKKLQKNVWDYYHEHGRHNLPWRKTKNPYRILVSEVMLQQTQVIRVIPKYKEFLKKFPTIHKLSQASLSEVLVVWQGLGYNRRAKALHDLSRHVVSEYGGKMPHDFETLLQLSGIGPYTAGALCAFAYNTPLAMIETNIRTVLFHHLFTDKKQVSDKELIEVAEKMVDTKNPREWYWALMDYGASLKESGVRVNSTSKHYTKQSKFKGSDREVRGAIIRLLTQGNATEKIIIEKTSFAKEKIQEQLIKLQSEKLLSNKGRLWSI